MSTSEPLTGMPASRERLTPMVAPFAALLDRLAERGFTSEAVDDESRVYLPHAEFERRRDGEGRPRYQDPTDCTGQLLVLDEAGPLWVVRCDACGFEVGVRMMSADPERLAAHLLERAGIPEMFAGREFAKGDALQEPTLRACREWVRAFPREPVPAIALWGQAGRGKSHLLCLMVETIIRTYGREARYAAMSALMDEFRSAARDGSFESRWQRTLNVPVLALDDIGAERITDAAREWFAALVDHRYSRKLPLLIATNLPPAAWESAFGERTSSRLRGICLPFKLEGPDRRSGQASFMDVV